jgi:hypothetical protein
MSSRAVRTQVRSLLADPVVTTICPFVETINVEQNPTDDIWFTAGFDFSFMDKLSFCQDFAEYGVIELVFESLPGTGDDAVLVAAESVTAELKKFNDPTGQLTLTSFSPPDEYSQGSADTAAYRVVVFIDYVFN